MNNYEVKNKLKLAQKPDLVTDTALICVTHHFAT